MKTWVIEIRDHATCIPALAIQMQADTQAEAYWIHQRCGHRNGSGLALMKLNDAHANFDPYDWSDRTMQTAHLWLRDHMDELRDCMVVDVRVVLGEAEKAVESERVERA